MTIGQTGSDAVREQVRARYAAAAIQVADGQRDCGCGQPADCGCGSGCCGSTRVLEPGGRIGITDVVAEDQLSAEDRAERGAWVDFNGAAAIETPEFMTERLDDFGGPDSYNHYAVGWAHAMDTPYQWTKQVASHFGGTRNGTVVHWPNGFQASGELRSQFHHIIDLAPTVLEVAGLPEPVSVNGVQQMPLQGVSMAYSFDGADEADRHETQYFEMFGNRGIYHKGWTAVTRHKTPWLLVGEDVPAFDDDRWELYDTTTDWSQARDLASEQPDKLHELQQLWLIEATKYNVLPLDDRVGERLNPDLAGRPVLIKGNRQLLFGGMGRLSESSVVSIKNKSHSVTAEVVVPASGAEGVIIAQGGSIGGWSLYAKDGKPKYCYNLLGVQRFYVEGDRPIPAGQHQVRMEFAYDGGGSARAATSCSSWTARRSARVALAPPRRWSSRPTTPATSAWKAGPWCRRTTARAATSSPAR